MPVHPCPLAIVTGVEPAAGSILRGNGVISVTGLCLDTVKYVCNFGTPGNVRAGHPMGEPPLCSVSL